MSINDFKIDEFGSRLSMFIKLNNLSQRDFAKQLNASPSFVSDLIRGIKKPGGDFLIRVKRQFDVSIDWLLFGDGSPQGNAKIKLELIKAIVMRLDLAKAALSENLQAKKALASIYPQITTEFDTKFHFHYLLDNNQIDEDCSLLTKLYEEFVDETLDDVMYEKIMQKVVDKLSEIPSSSDPLENLQTLQMEKLNVNQTNIGNVNSINSDVK